MSDEKIVARVAERYRIFHGPDPLAPESVLREIRESITDPEFKDNAKFGGLLVLSATEGRIVAKIPDPPRGHGGLAAVPDFIFDLDMKLEFDHGIYGKGTFRADIIYEPSGHVIGHIEPKTLPLKLYRSHPGLTYGKQLVQYLMVGVKRHFKDLYKALQKEPGFKEKYGLT